MSAGLSAYLPLVFLLALALLGWGIFLGLCALCGGRRAPAPPPRHRAQLPLAAHAPVLFYAIVQGGLFLLLLWASYFRTTGIEGPPSLLAAGPLCAVLLLGGIYAWRRGRFPCD